MSAWSTHSELGYAAQDAGDFAAAHEHHAAAARLLAEEGPAAMLQLGMEFLQLARVEILSGGSDAVIPFRSALACAAIADEPGLRGVVWHYIAAWCERRELWLAALLGYQEALEALPADDDDRRGRELRVQLLPLDRLGAWQAMLATLRLLENMGSTPDDGAQVLTSEDVMTQLELPAESRAVLERVLARATGPVMLRDELLARAHAAVSDFARRFETGELELEDTASAVLPDEAPPAAGPEPLDSGLDEVGAAVASALDELGDAIDRVAVWERGAEDALRAALGKLAAIGDGPALAYGWDRVGAYLLDRAQPAAALLAYAAELRLADAARVDDPRRDTLLDGGLYGAAYALADLHESQAQLACIALLERRGAIGIFAPVDVLLADQDLSPQDLQGLHERLDDDASCLAEIDAAVVRAQQRFGDFEARFCSGAERFDSPERLLELMREPARNPLLRDTSADRLRQLYRRRLFGWEAIAVATTLAAAALLARWRRWFVAVAAPALAVVAAISAQQARHARRWVRATAVTDDDRMVEEIERASSTHAQAYAILERCLREDAPFALYLRSFEAEGSERVGSKSESAEAEKARRQQEALMGGQSPSAVAAGFVGSREVVVSNLGPAGPVDAYLADKLAVHLPVVAVLNPVALATTGDVPRLELGHQSWALAVRMLISAARLIVMECTVLAPGVLEELEIVVNRRRTARTVVVLPSASTVRDLESRRAIGGIMGATELDYAPFITRDAAPLAPFDRVIDDDDLLASDPADLAVFDGLLPGLSQG